MRSWDIGRCADRLDDLVDMVERFFEAEQNMLASLVPW
jgi:hypothetical protein